MAELCLSVQGDIIEGPSLTCLSSQLSSSLAPLSSLLVPLMFPTWHGWAWLRIVSMYCEGLCMFVFVFAFVCVCGRACVCVCALVFFLFVLVLVFVFVCARVCVSVSFVPLFRCLFVRLSVCLFACLLVCFFCLLLACFLFLCVLAS